MDRVDRLNRLVPEPLPSSPVRRGLWLGALALPLLAGCPASRQTSAPPPAEPTPSIALVDVAAQAGVDFTLGNRGKTPLNILETAGGGCAFADLNGDERPDVVLVGPGDAKLYENLGGGRFRDITAGCGVERRRTWMGCAAGDYDGDGRIDLLFTGYKAIALYRNLGNGRFQDATRAAGIPSIAWSLGAAFGDLDLDGDLDLYVSQYLRFDGSTPQLCRLGTIRSACGPEAYDPLSGLLLLNEGGRFRAVSPWRDTGKTWGVLISSLTGESRPDIYLANDMLPGDLWVSRWVSRNGGYENQGPSSGTAYDAEGHLQGGMGVDSGDYDNDGRLDLLVTTFFAQPHSLYRSDGNGLFTVRSGPAGLAAPTMPYVGFGCAFVDLDNDGWLDLPIANGHVRDNVHGFDASQTYAQPLQVFRNESGRFREVSGEAFKDRAPVIVGRGLSTADFNGDGRMDLLVVDLEGKALLLENRSPSTGWLRVRLRQEGMNRHGLGALVTLRSGERTRLREIKTCGSVQSALDPSAHFGIGRERAEEVTVRWPGGETETYRLEGANREVLLRRGEGVSAQLTRAGTP